jgi:thiol-disulfide isomerase/thioredoxin
VKNRTVIIVVGVIVLVLGLAGAAVLLSGGDDESSGGVLAPGETAPPAFDGNAMSVGGATGDATLYVFLAHWCPHCNDEIPELIELRNRDGLPDGVNVVGVSTGVDSTGPNYPPSEWILDKNWPSEWPMMADSVESTAFVVNGGSGFPYLMIVDADGNVLARDSGAKSAEDLAAWLQSTVGANI